MTEHCTNCGQDADRLQLYTDCCNETTCSGTGARRWACADAADQGLQPAVVAVILACCSAVADQAARNAGRRVCWAA